MAELVIRTDGTAAGTVVALDGHPVAGIVRVHVEVDYLDDNLMSGFLVDLGESELRRAEAGRKAPDTTPGGGESDAEYGGWK